MWSWYSSEGCLPVSQEPMAGFEVSEPWKLPCPDESTATKSSMILNTRKIPEVQWLAYKEEIQFLYLTKNNSKEEVMAAMEKTHGFQASEAQYTRKLDEWGFKKYSTNAKWKFIARKLQKRKLEGKESDTYLDGKLVPQKKVKKEVSRHALPSWQAMSIAGRSPTPLAGIEIRTPPREPNPFVQYLHIPWFEFQTLVEPQIKRLNTLAHGHRKTPSVYEQPAPRSHNPLTWASSSKIYIATDQSQHQATAARRQIYNALQRPGNDKQAQNSIPSIQFQEETSQPFSAQPREQEARSLLAKFLGESIDPNSRDYLSTVTSQLDNILIERQGGEITRNLQKLFGSSIFEITLQLLRYSIYLSSNNLLSEPQTSMLLKWVVRNGQFAAIEHLIKLKTATTEVFASNILLSAVRIGHNSAVEALIALGIDVNIPGGCYPKDLALSVAIRVSTKEAFSRKEQEKFPLVRLLLEAGADINARSGPNNTSPLQEVISKRHLQLVQILLKYWTMDGLANEPNSVDTALRKAVRDGDSNFVEKLVNAKAHLNALTKRSMITPLQDAAMWHDTDTVQALLDIGADVDAPAGITYEAARKAAVKSGDLRHLQSAIQIAAYMGEIEMVQVLLEAGANVDGYLLTQEEYSAYEYDADRILEKNYNWFEACMENRDNFYFDRYYDIREECDQDCIHRPHFYWTPLQSAVERKDFVLVWVLLASGADIEGRGLGITPLQLAALKNESKLVRLLLKHGAAVNAPACGFSGRTALQAAAKNGNIELMAEFICLGADINAAASPINGRTCLQAAAEEGHTKLVQFLLDSGAEVNAAAAAKYGLTAIQAAATAGHLSVVKMLLTAGADIHLPSTERGYSAVSAAVRGENLGIVQLFLKTESPNGQGDLLPPILRASIEGETEIVQCLIEAGANINALRTDKPSLGYGYSCIALEAALRGGHQDIIDLLFDAGAGCTDQVPGLRAALGAASTIWRYSFEPIHMDIARKLLNAGADVNRAFSNIGMPLHNAVYIGRLELVQMLLDAGADVNSRTPDGNTALLNAIRKGNTDIIQVLLDAGADLSSSSLIDRGRTALQEAAARGNATVVRFLLERGADCNEPAADFKGVTALQAAAIGGHLPVALMLLDAGANINAPAAKIGGRRALEAAAEHGRLDIVSLFLENDIDTDGLASRCEGAAKLAERHGHIFISGMLRGHKQD